MPITRACPGCLGCVLVAVEGGLGKMGRCVKCGWTGPLHLRDEVKRCRWEGVRMKLGDDDDE